MMSTDELNGKVGFDRIRTKSFIKISELACQHHLPPPPLSVTSPFLSLVTI